MHSLQDNDRDNGTLGPADFSFLAGRLFSWNLRWLRSSVRERVKGWEALGNKKKVREWNWLLYISPPIPMKVLRALYIDDPGEYHR